MSKTRVLIVDDSALVRGLLTQIVNSDPAFEVVGTASDPYEAWRKIKSLEPDVLTLDVEMPRMDGITFLERLMHLHPMRVLMVSSLTERGCATTLRALEFGAVDFVAKPKVDLESGVRSLSGEFLQKLHVTSRAQVRGTRRADVSGKVHGTKPKAMLKTTLKLVAIGASTGGTEALKDVLCLLPPDSPPIVVVQHMPPGFTSTFAARLNDLCAVRVKEAVDGDRLMSGHVLIAPGDFHIALTRSGAVYGVRVLSAERVNRHRPSVDVLFDSFADHAGSNAIGVILTGMGDDGARGLKKMKDHGASTIAQDESTCVVFGMPREAIALGAADRIVPIGQVASNILELCG